MRKKLKLIVAVVTLMTAQSAFSGNEWESSDGSSVEFNLVGSTSNGQNVYELSACRNGRCQEGGAKYNGSSQVSGGQICEYLLSTIDMDKTKDSLKKGKKDPFADLDEEIENKLGDGDSEDKEKAREFIEDLPGGIAKNSLGRCR